MSKHIEFSDFDIKVCQDCVNACEIVDLDDLEARWDEGIAAWFIRMDFIPSNWYVDLHYLLGTRIIERYKK